MKTISIRMYNDQVYWLALDGFKKGTIKESRFVSNNQGTHQITYLCTCKEYDAIYMGDTPKIIFDTWEDMIDYYIKNKPN